MKTLMMSLVLVIASTACTTVGSTTVAKDEAGETKKAGDEEGLRKERQQALLEALEGTSAK